MKTIVRIEHISGNGIWQSYVDGDIDRPFYDEFSFSSELKSKHVYMNTPQEDGLDMTSQHYCAFKSIEQMNQWIEKEWYKELFEHDFKVLSIQVSDYQESMDQVIFKKRDIISSTDISDLFK